MKLGTLKTSANPPISSSSGITKRAFIQGSIVSIVLATHLPLGRAKSRSTSVELSTTFEANAFIQISSDSKVTVLIKHIEFGQGPMTGLATLAAEELDASWSQMHAEHAASNQKKYKNLFFGVQGTGGSSAMANSYEQMRLAGATARQLLVRAAALKWQVPFDEISISDGIVEHPASGRRTSFGDLISIAKDLPIPHEKPILKPANDFKLIGKKLPRLDTPSKLTGSAQYTLDIHQENMVVAVVAHPPHFGATVKSFDDKNALKIKGVLNVKKIPQGVCVYAKNTWAAIQGRQTLNIEWNSAKNRVPSSRDFENRLRVAVQKPGAVANTSGNVVSSFDQHRNHLSVDYHFPYLAHAPMEVLDAVIHIHPQKVDIWMGSQLQTGDQTAIAKVLNKEISDIHIHTQLAGGSFGRRAQAGSNFAIEAAMVAQNYEESVPVKFLWTREDDVTGGFYRPMAAHKIRGALNEKGHIVGWDHTIASQSIFKGTPLAGLIKDGIDNSSVEGAKDIPYHIENFRVTLHTLDSPVPVLWWRSVGHTHTAYVVETFIDLLLDKAGKDAITGRMALLNNSPREMAVLQRVRAIASTPLKAGRARGVAVHKSFGTVVAEIAEISLSDNEGIHVHKVWCAVDCGLAVNPDVIVAQMEGGIGYGLSAFLRGEVSMNEKGEVEQTNFHQYRPLRISEMPEIEVSILPSSAPPSGVGEPGLPPIAPAVANAWRRLTGKAITKLPFENNAV